MSKLSLLAVLTAVFFVSLPSAHAQESAAACLSNASASSSPAAAVHGAGYRQHDGFYLRMLAGAGLGGSQYREGLDLGGVETRMIGSAATLEIALGFALFDNLIVHATLNGGTVQEDNKQTGKHDYEAKNIYTLVGFFGGGLTYYIMPANVYVTGSVGVGGIGEVDDNGRDHRESEAGLGSSFALGKEWWLGRPGEWGLGVALTGAYYQAPLEIDHTRSTYRAFTTGAALSATFN
jgi:hypothetical protein